MSKYLPFGVELRLNEEQKRQKEYQFKMYDYYGIPYGRFDSSADGEQYISQKERDRDRAVEYILRGRDIPENLKAKLLQYKADEEKQEQSNKP